MTTCNSVNVDTDIPKIMTASFQIEEFFMVRELAAKKSPNLVQPLHRQRRTSHARNKHIQIALD